MDTLLIHLIIESFLYVYNPSHPHLKYHKKYETMSKFSS